MIYFEESSRQFNTPIDSRFKICAPNLSSVTKAYCSTATSRGFLGARACVPFFSLHCSGLGYSLWAFYNLFLSSPTSLCTLFLPLMYFLVCPYLVQHLVPVHALASWMCESLCLCSSWNPLLPSNFCAWGVPRSLHDSFSLLFSPSIQSLPNLAQYAGPSTWHPVLWVS